MKIKSITILLVCWLLFSLAVPAIGQPQCPDCPDCYEPTPDCDCVCASECCVDSDCGPCYNCVNCGCEYQCDPNEEVCCDGVCEPKCEDGEPTGQCDTSYNYECIGCTVFPYACSDFKMREYYGSEVTYCTGGCPGDCVQQNAVECYVEYECMFGSALPLYICATEGEGVACQHLGEWWSCTPCVKNDQEWVIEYAYPTKCQ